MRRSVTGSTVPKLSCMPVALVVIHSMKSSISSSSLFAIGQMICGMTIQKCAILQPSQCCDDRHTTEEIAWLVDAVGEHKTDHDVTCIVSIATYKGRKRAL